MDVDDFDWAMGELLHLFNAAARQGTLPHLLNPAVFRTSWSVLNAQPFEVAQHAHQLLMWHYKPRLAATTAPNRPKRYAYSAPRIGTASPVIEGA